MDVPPGMCILWALLSDGPQALLSGKPTPENSCYGLFPALSLVCPVAPDQAIRTVVPQPMPAWPARAYSASAQGQNLSTGVLHCYWQSCHPRKASSAQAFLGVLCGGLLKWKEEAVRRPLKSRMVGLQIHKSYCQKHIFCSTTEVNL